MNESDAIRFVNENFSFQASNIDCLPSYEDQNFRVGLQLFKNDGDSDGLESSLVLKVSRANYDRAILEREHEIMDFVAKSCKKVFQVAQLLPMKQSRCIVNWTDHENNSRLVRAFQWLPGKVVGSIPYKSQEFFVKCGECVGMLSNQLSLFSKDSKQT